VLAYAEELGFLEKISLELQGEIAIAESQLAIWLSEPQQMGLAPTQIDLIDNREMYWPDIRHLSPDDCYALFAGWQTTHQEIFQMGVEQATQLHASEMRRLQSLLSEQQLEDQQIQTAAGFFGETVLIATGKLDNSAGTAVVDQADVTWVPAGATAAPIDWELASALWRGRRLLTTFNHQDRV